MCLRSYPWRPPPHQLRPVHQQVRGSLVVSQVACLTEAPRRSCVALPPCRLCMSGLVCTAAARCVACVTPAAGVSNLALAVSATAFASCHAWSLRGQSLSAAAALLAVAVKPSPAWAPCPVGVANPAALHPLGCCMVNGCLLLQPVCFLRGLARATPSLVQRGAVALPCHLHCLAAPCQSLAGSWHSLIADPPPLFVGPVAGTLSGAPPTVPAWLGGSPSDQPQVPGPVLWCTHALQVAVWHHQR